MDKMKKSIQDAFDLALDVVERPEQYPARFVAIPATSPLAGKLFTAERRRLIQELKLHGPFASVALLAMATHRDSTRVGRDLKPLVDAGLVAISSKGKNKQVSATNRPLVIQ